MRTVIKLQALQAKTSSWASQNTHTDTAEKAVTLYLRDQGTGGKEVIPQQSRSTAHNYYMVSIKIPTLKIISMLSFNLLGQNWQVSFFTINLRILIILQSVLVNGKAKATSNTSKSALHFL